MATFFIKDVFKIVGIGVVSVGQVKSGVLRVGMKLNLDGRIMEIKIMESHNKKVSEAIEGDTVGISLTNADYNILKNHRGDYVEFF